MCEALVQRQLGVEASRGDVVVWDGDPLEIGASQRDFDYMHIIDWRKAAEVVVGSSSR